MTTAISHEPIVRVNTPGEVVLTPGGQAHARIELVVADGYHVQANPVSQAFLVPLRLNLRGRQRIRAGKASYPPGVPYRLEGDDNDLMTYGGVVGIDVSLEAEEAAVPGRYTLRGVLHYQGCDRRLCLFPAQERVALSVRVLPADHVSVAGTARYPTPHEGKKEDTMQAVQTKCDWVAVADELGPAFAERASAHDADDSFVTANYEDLKAARVFSAGVPAELGGGDASLAELCDMLRTFAHYCSSTALALSMHTHQVAIPAWRWRNEQAPVEGLLKRVAAEQIVLISTGGSDWLNGSGKAERVDGGYRVSGRKIFGSGSPSGTLLMTTAVFEDPEGGPMVLHMPIPIASEGVRVLDNWRTMGMRATGSNDVVIENVFVPESAIGVRRPKGTWHRFMHTVVMNAFPLIYSVYVGVAEAARNLALREANKKRDDPNVQFLVGEMEDELAGTQFALRHMVDVAMTSQPEAETTNRVMIGRALAGRGAIRTVEKAFEVAGGAAFFRSMGLERLFRDVQGARFHPLQEKPQLLYAGRIALGLPVDG